MVAASRQVFAPGAYSRRSAQRADVEVTPGRSPATKSRPSAAPNTAARRPLTPTAMRPTAADPRTSAAPRILRWSGYDWIVKDSTGPVGPGPNRFSDSSRNVWVDPSGRLHLRIENRNGRWWCAELWTTTALGYGNSVF